jgi:hypothetical protein
MSDRLKLGREAFQSGITYIHRAYRGFVYEVTKASLEPVVAATSDVIREAVAQAVREGVKDAFTPANVFGDLFFNRRK